MNLKTKKPLLERIRDQNAGTFTRSDFFNWIDGQEA